VVAILIVTAVLSYTDRQVLSLLVDPLRADLHISDTQVSLLMGTAFAVIYGLTGIPLGRLADRISRRNLILAGVSVWSVGTIGCGLSQNFAEIFASRIVVGMGEAALAPAAISLISDYFPPSLRGTAVGFFLSGIAIGAGAAILIGGSVLHGVQLGLLADTPLAGLAPWRMVFLVIGAPGLLWALVILVIREPVRRANEVLETTGADPGPDRGSGGADANANASTWVSVVPIYLVLAAASFADNAVGAWAPTLLIRQFHRDAAQVGIELGLLLAVGYGGGVLIGGVLADRAALTGGPTRKLRLCLAVALLILPVSLLMNASGFELVLAGIPLYFALSGSVTAVGFSAILDVIPNRSRGLAMAISFFLNVALGAGLGPTAVALAGAHLFSAAQGLGPPLIATVAGGYLIALLALCTALLRFRQRPALRTFPGR
jgi:MFS family permease